MARLDVYQSMWAMELRRPDKFEWSLEEKFKKIADAGYRGVCMDLGHHDFAFVSDAMPYVTEYGLELIFNAFVKDETDYQKVVNFACELNRRPRFISIIGQVEPWDVAEVAGITRGWLEIGRQADVPTYVETHRNCMTNDLLFTLQLLEMVPELMLVADLSHPLINQEWYLPLPERAQELVSLVLKRSESFQGRVATREQIQVSVKYPQHQEWYALFKSWWREGFHHWLDRHGPEAKDNCIFLCELGPPCYGITGSDGYELVDRWEEAQIIKSDVEAIWEQSLQQAPSDLHAK